MLVRDDLPDWENNACLNVVAGGEDYAYIEGYLRAGRTIARHVVETGRSQDLLVYPMVFLYRHHVELVLKWILVRAVFLLDLESHGDLEAHFGTHGLGQLWQDLRPMLPRIYAQAGWDGVDTDELEGVESYIQQLQQLDATSISFRYARTRKGGPSLPDGLRRINVRHFAETMERLVAFLDAAHQSIGHLADKKAEMESEQGQNR